MKPIVPLRFLMPAGLLLIAGSFWLKHIINVPDFADGFMKGVGISVLLISLIKQWYQKRQQA